MDLIPVIDLAPLIAGDIYEVEPAEVAAQIDRACREVGFFSIVNHGIDPALCRRVDALAREFFAQPILEKQRVAMVHGGSAWRGWFPLRGELTSGKPDHKEGYYFGREIPVTDPRVCAGTPLHGPNLWPSQPVDLRETVLEYIGALEALSQQLTRAISVGLGLAPNELAQRWFRDPTILLRLFRYPPATPDAPAHGVGEHTDYGFLTLLWQDDNGGLEIRADHGWVEVPPNPNAFVCNIGDMLDRLTSGRYRSTPHRVRSPHASDRIAIPFFFDPDWDARIDALPLMGDAPADDASSRWDRTSVHQFRGSYGEYLIAKVAPVFPALGEAVLKPTNSR